VGGYWGRVQLSRLGLLVGPGLVPAGAAVLAFGLIMVTLLRRTQALGLPAYDNAFFEQVVWNLGHGRGFAAPGFYPANFLSLHFSPLLALPALLELAWPDPRLLIFLQALALAASAPAAFLFLRRLLAGQPRGEWVAAALAAPLPFWSELQEAARAGFHTEALALPLILLAGWAGLSGRRWLCSGLALAALAAREDQVYAVAVVGLLLFFHGPSKRFGATILATAVAWGVLTEMVVMPGLRGVVVSQVDDYYRWLQTASPAALAAALFAPAGWIAFGGMVVSMVGLPLLRPGWLALVLPPLGADLLSAHQPQPQLLFQYGQPLVVPLLVAGGLGASRLLGRRPASWLPGRRPSRPARRPHPGWRPRPPGWAIAGVALPPLLVGLASGPLAHPLQPPSTAMERLLACTSRLPDRAPLAADDAAALALSARPLLKLSTEAGPADFVLVDREGRVPAYIDTRRRLSVLTGLPAGGRRVLCDDGRFQLWSPAGG
jgi:uncharacterized membrane protein